jgi:hypothetical protein
MQVHSPALFITTGLVVMARLEAFGTHLLREALFSKRRPVLVALLVLLLLRRYVPLPTLSEATKLSSSVLQYGPC